MSARPLFILSTLALLGPLACGGDDGDRGDEPPHLLYSVDAQSLDNPFPDLRLLGDEGLAARPRWYEPFLAPAALTVKMARMLDRYGEAMREVNGLGNFGSTLVRPSEKLDRASLQGVAARLERDADGSWRVLQADVKVEHVLDALDGPGVAPTEGIPEFLLARPGIPLREGAEGLLVFKRGLKTAGGAELGRGFGFEDDAGSQERISTAAATLGIPEEDVLLALPLRAANLSDRFVALAAWAQAHPPAFTVPAKALEVEGSVQYPVGIWRQVDADWSTVRPLVERWQFARPASHVALIAQGTMQARELREDGVMREDWMADPSLAPTQPLQFVLTLPDGPKPPGGYRVVIGAHGLNGRNTFRLHNSPQTFCGEVAELLARDGMGCIGIDAPSHGARGSSFDFFNIPDLRHTRDNFRQMTFDLLQLASVAANLDVDGDGTADLSPELGYFGNSLGAIMGASFVSYEPRVDYALLNVGGGGLSNLLLSDELRDRIGLLIVKETSLEFTTPEYYATFPFFRAAAQVFMDAADPVVLAEHMRGDGRAVLIQEGLRDVTIANFATEDLARSIGAEAKEASVAPGGPVRALVRIEPARYLPPDRVASYNGHNIFWDFEPVRIQALNYLETRGTQLIVE